MCIFISCIQCQLKRVVGKTYTKYKRLYLIFLSYIYLYSGVDSSKCTDWTTTRRAGYKPGPNEPQYTTTRGFNSQGKSSKKSRKINKSGSKKRSAQ